MLINIIKKTIYGVAYGCTINTLVTIIIILANGQMYDAPMFLRSSIAGILVGIAFCAPTVVYDKESMPLPLKMLIHLGIGFVVYFPAAIYAGWMPLDMGTGVIISFIALALVGSLAVWAGFYFYYKAQARKMTARIREKTGSASGNEPRVK